MTEPTEAEKLAYRLKMLTTNVELVIDHTTKAAEALNRIARYVVMIEEALDKRIPPQIGEAIGCVAMIGMMLMALAYAQVLA